MRARPERVAEAVICQFLTVGWGLEVDELRFHPEGGGAYHWIAGTADDRRWFVTCDDLDTKPWLGHDRDQVLAGLRATYQAAVRLHASGLAFVVAPVPTLAGECLARLDARHALSVFEYVEGEPLRWGRPPPRGAIQEVVTMLAALHLSAVDVGSVARRELAVAGRGDLEAALRDLDQGWDGGPMSEPARHVLAEHEDRIASWLVQLDRAAGDLAGCDATAVVTHGEPHPGNLIRTSSGLALVDWDTVALARPERDLWMLERADDDVATQYQKLTGVALDGDAMSAHRLLWAVADVAAFTAQLRSEHSGGADDEWALRSIRAILDGAEPAPYGPPR